MRAVAEAVDGEAGDAVVTILCSWIESTKMPSVLSHAPSSRLFAVVSGSHPRTYPPCNPSSCLRGHYSRFIAEMSQPYLDVFIGDMTKHEDETAAYNKTRALLDKNASIYGLPDTPQLLTDEQKEILQDLSVSRTFDQQRSDSLFA